MITISARIAFMIRPCYATAVTLMAWPREVLLHLEWRRYDAGYLHREQVCIYAQGRDLRKPSCRRFNEAMPIGVPPDSCVIRQKGATPLIRPCPLATAMNVSELSNTARAGYLSPRCGLDGRRTRRGCNPNASCVLPPRLPSLSGGAGPLRAAGLTFAQ